MILYSHPASPFGRHVLMAIYVLGLIDKVSIKQVNTHDPEDNIGKINPDARYKGKEGDMKAILEVEGPRAWVASAWAKDLTKAMKTKQDYLILAVRKHYKAGSAKKPSNDFKRIGDELAYLNCLPLKAVLLIGYRLFLLVAWFHL